MKTITIGIFAILVLLSFGFNAGGLWDSKTPGPVPKLKIEKAVPAKVAPDALTNNEKAVQDNSIFSWPTIITLSVAVIGIVTFRRNTYS